MKRHEATVLASEDRLLTRDEVATRWGCCRETVRRKELLGILTPVRIGPRFVRYHLSEVLKREAEASA